MKVNLLAHDCFSIEIYFLSFFRYKQLTVSHEINTHHSGSNMDNIDMEVAVATGHGLSRQSSMGSYSDMPSRAATETPSEEYSDSDTDRSSPIDIDIS